MISACSADLETIQVKINNYLRLTQNFLEQRRRQKGDRETTEAHLP